MHEQTRTLLQSLEPQMLDILIDDLSELILPELLAKIEEVRSSQLKIEANQIHLEMQQILRD